MSELLGGRSISMSELLSGRSVSMSELLSGRSVSMSELEGACNCPYLLDQFSQGRRQQNCACRLTVE